jgi:type I restriction enzyme S subunit
VADFEGVTANTTYVLESADPKVLLPELLPFIMQTEAFSQHSVRESKGSVNPYVNFSDLSWFEFALPPIEEQRRMVEVLQASSAMAESIAHARSSADQLFQSKVDHVFVKAASQEAYKVTPLSDLSDKIVDGVHKRPDYVDEGVPFLTVENLTRGPGIDFSDTRFITPADHEEFIKRANPERGDVLISKDGTLGVPRVVESDIQFSIFVSVALVKPKRGILDPWFLRFYFESSLFKRHIASRFSGSALKHIHLVDLRESPVPVMDFAEQQETARILSDVHAGLLAIRNREDRFRATMQEILAVVIAEGS